jgi:hypothetical protein
MKKIHPDQQTGASTGPQVQVLVPCKFLRSKEMFYEQPGDGADVAFASDVYWCSKTQEAFGPDGEPAEKSECQCGRSCYVCV